MERATEGVCREDGNEQTHSRGRAEETEPVKEGRDEELRNISGQNSVLLFGHPIINSKEQIYI